MPQLLFSGKAISENIRNLDKLCRERNIEFLSVVKAIELRREVLELFVSSPSNKGIAVSSWQLSQDCEQMLITPLSLTNCVDVIKNGLITCHCNLYTIRKLAQEAQNLDIPHRIVITVDMGDMREGVAPEELVAFIEEAREICGSHISIIGIMTNYACCSGLMPTLDNLEQFAKLAENTSKETGIVFDVVSVGGSVVLSILESSSLPETINQIRVGEALLLGNIPAINRQSQLLGSVVRFEAEIVDINNRDITLANSGNKNALGEILEDQPLGKSKRAILNFGSIHTVPNKLVPPTGFKLVSVNSNCSVYDISNTEERYEVGDRVEFELEYSALLSASHSIHVSSVVN